MVFWFSSDKFLLVLQENNPIKPNTPIKTIIFIFAFIVMFFSKITKIKE